MKFIFIIGNKVKRNVILVLTHHCLNGPRTPQILDQDVEVCLLHCLVALAPVG